MAGPGLVGSLGAELDGAASGAVTPVYGQTPTANNVLILWCDGTATVTLPGTPAGWSVLVQNAAGVESATTFYKVAAGGDAQPTVAGAAGTTWHVQLGEFSGCAFEAPVDQFGSTGATATKPVVANAASTDAASGELVIYNAMFKLSSAGTTTTTSTLNNGMTNHDTNNDTASVAAHYSWGWAITTGHAAADQDSATLTGTISSGVTTIGSFKLAPASGPTSGFLAFI